MYNMGVSVISNIEQHDNAAYHEHGQLGLLARQEPLPDRSRVELHELAHGASPQTAGQLVDNTM